MEFKGLVACRAGVGSSLMLKIKLNQVISENKLPIKIEHGSLDAVSGFNGQLLITLSDVADELAAKKLPQTIIGIDNIMDKAEILKNSEIKYFSLIAESVKKNAATLIKEPSDVIDKYSSHINKYLDIIIILIINKIY